MRTFSPVLALTLAALLATACGPTRSDTAETAPSEHAAPIDNSLPGTQSDAASGAVVFSRPVDGAAVTSPVEVCLEAKGVDIEPSGEVRSGAGHHHVIVDPSADELAAILAGEPVVLATDDTHIHMGDGTACRDLELTPGAHTLLAVVADGIHQNLQPPVTAQISITVSE